MLETVLTNVKVDFSRFDVLQCDIQIQMNEAGGCVLKIHPAASRLPMLNSDNGFELGVKVENEPLLKIPCAVVEMIGLRLYPRVMNGEIRFFELIKSPTTAGRNPPHDQTG